MTYAYEALGNGALLWIALCAALLVFTGWLDQ